VKPYLTTDRATLYHACAEEVYPHLDPGSVSMVWSDGPYAMNKAEWDRMGVDGLADWYAPHVEAWGRVCAPSATVYLWNTAAGWARLDPVMRAAGWTFRTLLVWDKGLQFMAGKGLADLRMFPDVTEVCGFYQREPSEVDLWNTYGADHPVRVYLDTARRAAGLSLQQIDEALEVSGMARHWFTWSQWTPPSPDRYAALQRLIPALTASLESLRRAQDDVWAVFRARWQSVRVPFNPPERVTNVWPCFKLALSERMPLHDGETHPCQKPLAFADRAIRASTRIGDTILDPFAGTNRIAVACRRLPAEERRHAIGIEMDRRWLDAVRPSLVADHGHVKHPRQPSLFASLASPDTPSP